MLITSPSNSQIKQIRKLKERKYRAESGLFFLEGIRIVIEALEAGGYVEQLIISRELLDNEKALQSVDAALAKNIPLIEVNREVFESLSSKDGPQGLAAVARQQWTSLAELDGVSGVWAALYEVADPGNLGTLLRTLDGMGGMGVFLLDHCTDPYDPSAIRASMGAIFSKKIVKITTDEFIGWAAKNQLKLIGTSDAAQTNYRRFQYPDNLVLMMGSEREGLPAKLAGSATEMVSIPMQGSADSLNLAVAASIVLYEIAAQHAESR